MAKLRITQIRSKNGETKRQIANLRTLGIRKMHHVSIKIPLELASSAK